MLLQNNVFMEKQYFEPEHRSGVLFKNPMLSLTHLFT